jgi:hypothetical protein
VVAELPSVNIVFASDGAKAQWSALKGMRARLPDVPSRADCVELRAAVPVFARGA